MGIEIMPNVQQSFEPVQENVIVQDSKISMSRTQPYLAWWFVPTFVSTGDFGRRRKTHVPFFLEANGDHSAYLPNCHELAMIILGHGRRPMYYVRMLLCCHQKKRQSQSVS